MIEDIPHKTLPELIFSRDMLAEYITVANRWEDKTGMKSPHLYYSKEELRLLDEQILKLKGKSNEPTEL